MTPHSVQLPETEPRCVHTHASLTRTSRAAPAQVLLTMSVSDSGRDIERLPPARNSRQGFLSISPWAARYALGGPVREAKRPETNALPHYKFHSVMYKTALAVGQSNRCFRSIRPPERQSRSLSGTRCSRHGHVALAREHPFDTSSCNMHQQVYRQHAMGRLYVSKAAWSSVKVGLAET